MVSRTPARRSRSKRRTCQSFVACATRRAGQPRPAQTTVMRAPRGARTVSRVTRAPESVSRPLMRMTGNGRSMRGLAGAAGRGRRGGRRQGGGGEGGGGEVEAADGRGGGQDAARDRRLGRDRRRSG